MGFVKAGAVFALLAVALGAFGAHVLKSRMSADMLAVYQTGVSYEMYHALALIAVGILLQLGRGGQWLPIAGWLFAVGIVLFSGSLYLLSVTDTRWLGAITPLGGLCFLAGWILLIFAV